MNVIPIENEFDAALSLARQALFRFAALCLVDPKVGNWKQLNHIRELRLLHDAAALVRDEPAAMAESLAPNERVISHLDPASVLARLPGSPSDLNDEYELTFGLLVTKACPPYETEYIDGKFTFQRSHALADISGFYQAFGLEPSDELPERHDHIVLELEFMALLHNMERRAWSDKMQACKLGQIDDSLVQAHRMAVCQAAQTRFVKEHLAWWVPAFCKLLGRENPGGFYEAVACFISALIPADRALLGVEVAAARAVSPSAFERPEECEGCMLAGS